MTNVKTKQIFRILMAAVSAAVAVLLVWGCWQIGLSGALTRELVGSRLRGMIPVFALWLAVLAVNLVLGIRDEDRPAECPSAYRLSLLLRRREPTPSMQAEKLHRRTVTATCCSVCVLLALLAGVGLYRRSIYTTLQSRDAWLLILHWFLPVLPIYLAANIIAELMLERSLRRECKLAAQAPAKAADPPMPLRPQALWPRWVVLGLSLLLIVLGICNGGMRDVLREAVKICSECIGLG